MTDKVNGPGPGCRTGWTPEAVRYISWPVPEQFLSGGSRCQGECADGLYQLAST